MNDEQREIILHRVETMMNSIEERLYHVESCRKAMVSALDAADKYIAEVKILMEKL